MASRASRGGMSRALAALALGLMAAPLALGVGGCSSQPPIMPARPMPNNVMDLSMITGYIQSNARPWRTLKAHCSVVISSPQFTNVRNHQVSFLRGEIEIEKPGKIRLEAVTGQRRIFLVGDGAGYRVDMPVFNDGYEGKYNDPLPVQPRRILLLPQDLVCAWDWGQLLKGEFPVLKNLQGGAVLEMLDVAADSTVDVRAASELAFDRNEKRITSAEIYSKDTSVRSQIVVQAVDTVPAGPDKTPVRIPSRVWLSYPKTWTSIQITLRDIQLNTELPADTFDLKS